MSIRDKIKQKLDLTKDESKQSVVVNKISKDTVKKIFESNNTSNNSVSQKSKTNNLGIDEIKKEIVTQKIKEYQQNIKNKTVTKTTTSELSDEKYKDVFNETLSDWKLLEEITTEQKPKKKSSNGVKK